MTDVTDDRFSPPYLRRQGTALIVSDFFIARRQRLHLVLDPWTLERAQHRRLLDALAWLRERSISCVVICDAETDQSQTCILSREYNDASN